MKNSEDPKGKEPEHSSTVGVKPQLTGNGIVTAVSSSSSRPPTSLGSRQGDHASAYRLITYVLEKVTKNCSIDVAIANAIALIDTYSDTDFTQEVIEKKIKQGLAEMRSNFLVAEEGQSLSLFEKVFTFAIRKQRVQYR